jgi:hypothetical protein
LYQSPVIRPIWRILLYQTDRPRSNPLQTPCFSAFSAFSRLFSPCIKPLVILLEESERTGIDWIHRTGCATDIYFVSNQRAEAARFTAVFRQKPCSVELWDAVTGARTPVPCEATADRRRVRVGLDLAAGGSVFVVFNKGVSRSCATADAQERVPSRFTLDGPWSVSFDPKWGGPEQSVTFPALTDWTTHADLGIRYYSGTAVYRKTFDAPTDFPADASVTIDLGALRDIAQVTLNGQDLGIAWTPPFAVTAPRLKEKGNVLEISVVNLWANRLIRDAALPPTEQLTKTDKNPFRKDHALFPSGLYGPVSINCLPSTP